MSILVTGGTGFIGSHTCIELLRAGYEIVILDNLCNSREDMVRRIAELGGAEFAFYKEDIRDGAALDALFAKNDIDVVLHFAGFKAVGESVERSVAYYENNVGGTLTLLMAMQKAGVRSMVFSSSATVYGVPKSLPLDELAPVDFASLTNPYGRSKAMIEQILTDACQSDPSFSACLLRYFNPVGAHESGKIGEAPNGIPNNLMPRMLKVAAGEWPALTVYGNDFPTRDGTGVRDYIHVCDLATGHCRALEYIKGKAGCQVFNLGTGVGYSVLEMAGALEKVSGRAVPVSIVARRAGDVAEVYSDPTRAERELGWKAELGLERMCADSWRWYRQA